MGSVQRSDAAGGNRMKTWSLVWMVTLVLGLIARAQEVPSPKDAAKPAAATRGQDLRQRASSANQQQAGAAVTRPAADGYRVSVIVGVGLVVLGLAVFSVGFLARKKRVV